MLASLKRPTVVFVLLVIFAVIGFLFWRTFSPPPSLTLEPPVPGEEAVPLLPPASAGLASAPSGTSSGLPTLYDGSPEGVFREALQAFYEAQTYEQYKAATLRYADSGIVQQALATPDDQITPQQKESMLLALKVMLPVPDSIREVRTELASDAATLTVTVQGSDTPLTVLLVREDGVWKWHQLRVGAQ